MLNKAKDYYKNNKERLRDQARNKYKNLSEEDKNKEREYRKNRYHNISKEKKQKLKEFQKNYREAKESKYNNECNSFLIMSLMVSLIIMIKLFF